MTQRELLVPVCLIGIGISILIPVSRWYADFIGFRDYKSLYQKAAVYAEERFGDKQSPLTSNERDQWYSLMEVEPNDVPTPEQLEKFIENNKN